MEIVKGGLNHLEAAARLFDQYRQFYGQPSDLEGAREFLKTRLLSEESVIFLARKQKEVWGFTQLYPSFSSISMEQTWILNDLYVTAQRRNQGTATALLKHAQQFVDGVGAKGLALETAVDNPAQELYKRLGWRKDEAFCHYYWSA